MFSLTSSGSSLLNLTTELPRAPGPGPASLPHFGQAGSGLGAPPRWGEAGCEALPYPHRGNYPAWAGHGGPLELISFLWERYEGFCDVLGCPCSDGCPLASSWLCWGGMQWFVLLPSSPCPRSHWAASSSSLWSPQTAQGGSPSKGVLAGCWEG